MGTLKGEARLQLAEALRALRTGALGPTANAKATEAIRARTDPLMGDDGAGRGPPCHGARCLVPPLEDVPAPPTVTHRYL